MKMTLQEIMDTCNDWHEFCDLKGFNPWALNEGGGDVEVSLTILEAHTLGIVSIEGYKLAEYMIEEIEDGD